MGRWIRTCVPALAQKLVRSRPRWPGECGSACERVDLEQMRPHVRRAAAIVATFALLLCAFAQAGGAATTSGVRGLLRLSHGCPGPVREGDRRRCDFAGAGILVRAFTLSGVALAAARTDARGRFAIALPPGRYLLRAQLPKAKDQAQPVRVNRANWTVLTLRYLVPPYME